VKDTQLDKHPLSIIELGSGVGGACCVLNACTSNIQRYTCTDAHTAVMQLCADNIDLNRVCVHPTAHNFKNEQNIPPLQTRFASKSSMCETVELDWTQPQLHRFTDAYDLLLASGMLLHDLAINDAFLQTSATIHHCFRIC
jgi:hypothetical protein